MKSLYKSNLPLCYGGLPGGLFLLLHLLTGPVLADVLSATDPETGLASWTWRDRGVSLQLLQLLPDQTRAFFLGRGFRAGEADRVGRACVFQTIFRNDGLKPVEYDLTEWSVYHKVKHLPLQTREVWEQYWLEQNIGKGPRIAFRWALLPTRQRFEPGDYNWGMTSFGLMPGEGFDLSLSMRMGDAPVSAEISGITCAPDR